MKLLKRLALLLSLVLLAAGVFLLAARGLSNSEIAAGEFRIFEATRETITDPFGPPILTPGLADVAADEPWISPDGQTLFFSVEVPEMRIWTTTRACP